MITIIIMVHLSATNQKGWERALVAARSGINRGDEPEAPAPPVGVQALRQRQVRLSDEQKAELAAEYAAGGNIRQLAVSWGVSREAVRSALKQQHVPMRQVKLTPRQLAVAAELKTQGWSLNQLGSHNGVDPKTMKKRLQNLDGHEKSPLPPTSDTPAAPCNDGVWTACE